MLRPDLGPNIGIASYSVNHAYASSDNYLVSYVEPNRNGGVLNMEDSFATTFYIETLFDLTTPSLCFGSPFFIAPSIFSGFTDSELTFSLGAASNPQVGAAPTQTLITYEMAVPLRDRGMPVIGYWFPENITLNYLTGLLTWNTESAAPGEYNFAVNAVQWGRENESLVVIGYTRIDFQVILSDEPSETLRIHDNQELDEYSRILVPEGDTQKVRIFYEVDDNTTPLLEMFSVINGAPGDDVASFIAYDSVSPPSGKKIKVGVLTITPGVDNVQGNTNLIVIRGRVQGQAHVSDISYLIYTDEFPAPPEIITATEDPLADVQVFPNPVQSHISIQVNQSEASEVLIYNLQGQLIKLKTFESKTELFLQELAPGIYICDIRRNNLSVRKIKLIKE
jgi:hypothetical protein